MALPGKVRLEQNESGHWGMATGFAFCFVNFWCWDKSCRAMLGASLSGCVKRCECRLLAVLGADGVAPASARCCHTNSRD
jgi:hypothetical protein